MVDCSFNLNNHLANSNRFANRARILFPTVTMNDDNPHAQDTTAWMLGQIRHLSMIYIFANNEIGICIACLIFLYNIA